MRRASAGGKGCIERSGFVGVEVVQYDTYHFRLRIPLIDPPAHLLGKVLHGPLRGDSNMPPADLRFTEQQEVAGLVALIFIKRRDI